MDCLRHRRRHHSNVGHLAVVIIVCVGCLLMADMSVANYTHWCAEQDTIYNLSGNNQGLCGSSLSSTLSWVCRKNGYNGRSKRAISASHSPDSADALLARLMDPRGTESVEERSSQFLDGSKALAFLQYKRQSYGGLVQNIICECCVNDCSMDELRTYCRQ